MNVNQNCSELQAWYLKVVMMKLPRPNYETGPDDAAPNHI